MSQNTMKQYENLAMIEKYTIAMKRIAEYEAKIKLHQAVADKAMEGLKQLETNARNPKKRARKEDTSLPTPPPEVKKIKSNTMTHAEAMEYRTNPAKLHAIRDGRKLVKVCRALKGVTRKEIEELKWTTEEKKNYIVHGVEPKRPTPTVIEDSSDEEYEAIDLSSSDEEEEYEAVCDVSVVSDASQVDDVVYMAQVKGRMQNLEPTQSLAHILD